MFQLTITEWLNLKSQFLTSSWGGRRTLPYAFTEQGVAMLSSVLKSETAIHVNIQIIRVFTRLREVLLTNKDILLKLEQLEKKMMRQDEHLKKHEDEIQIVFRALKQLIQQPTAPRKRIGFNTQKEH